MGMLEAFCDIFLPFSKSLECQIDPWYMSNRFVSQIHSYINSIQSSFQTQIAPYKIHYKETTHTRQSKQTIKDTLTPKPACHIPSLLVYILERTEKTKQKNMLFVQATPGPANQNKSLCILNWLLHSSCTFPAFSDPLMKRVCTNICIIYAMSNNTRCGFPLNSKHTNSVQESLRTHWKRCVESVQFKRTNVPYRRLKCDSFDHRQRLKNVTIDLSFGPTGDLGRWDYRECSRLCWTCYHPRCNPADKDSEPNKSKAHMPWPEQWRGTCCHPWRSHQRRTCWRW